MIRNPSFDNLPCRTAARESYLAYGVGHLPKKLIVANGASLETGKLLRLARVISRADEVFDDLDAAVDWLKSPNAALRGNAPLSLLDTDIDAEAMLDTLGRIERGVFA